jgi:hypothetical protein
MIPQVPGSIKRSHSIDGVMESVVKSKKYVLPLAVLNPEVAAGLVVAYLTDGRFKAPKNARVEIVPGEPMTKTDEATPGAPSATIETLTAQPLTETPPAAPGIRRPLPAPTTPQ